MNNPDDYKSIIGKDDLILVTGAGGFIGCAVIRQLVSLGYRRIRGFVRSSRSAQKLRSLANDAKGIATVEVMEGNLLSQGDCTRAAQDVKVVLHLAAGRGEKSFPDAVLNSVVTTRNLIEALLSNGNLRRFVSVSSFAVYSGSKQVRIGQRVLNESWPVEPNPELRGEAYTFAKVKQDEIVAEYGSTANLPYVIVRPGHVYGRGNEAISARVGVGTFGIFLHLGGPNRIPFTYVENCADAIIRAGLTPGIDTEVFNVVDDDLPTSRQFLHLYKKNVKHFRSIYLPHMMSYLLCGLWERFSQRSQAQIPMVFNLRRWRAFWARTQYSNQKAKERLGWTPRVSMSDGLNQYFEACRERGANA